MASQTTPAPRPTTVGDLLARLGGIPAGRVRLHPTPGTATEQDMLDVRAREDRLCELVDGVLVEKPMGFEESRIAVVLIGYLISYLKQADLGCVLGADAAVRLFPGLVRIPDVAFISWARYPKGKRGRGTIPSLAPDLAVEVLSKGNPKKEMRRKLGEYFRAGVRLVWYVDPKSHTVRVYTAPDRSVLLTEGQVLDGGDVLPGFALPLRTWFAEAERSEPK
jgi:Uma2 family endonuclease